MKIPPLASFKAFVFDFDGTLVHSNEVKEEGMTAVTKELGDVSAHLKDILDKKLGDRFVIFKVLAERLEREGRLPATKSVQQWGEDLTNAYTDYCEKNIVAAKEVQGATAFLKELKKRRIPAFINTATPEEPVQVIVKKKNWNGYFQAVLGGPKAKVTNLQIISAELGVPISKMVFVGDGEPDRAACEEAGCLYIGLQTRFSQYKKPLEYTINNLEELLNIF